MSDIVITAHGVSKQYRIGARQERYRTLRDSLAAGLAAPLRRLRGDRNPGRSSESIWALRDVSFDVPRGEVLGLIGRNGAGKSTLLKILSEITYPTEGRVEIRGRVGSLLEIGTGFHPELTGRENIFLNGAILGMTRAEIRRKFDEIVAFAEVDKFIDTPVKRYSSGMHVRLAFAVAAHLEPEILLVDEVLAVGDAQFQKKCMGKMGDVARHAGRTIVFVSHNLSAIQQLCDRVIVLDRGQVACIDDASRACERYLQMISGGDAGRAGFVTSGPFELRGMRIEGPEGRMPTPLEPATVVIPLRFRDPCPDPHIHLFVQTADGQTVFGLGSSELLRRDNWPPSRDFELTFRIARLPLMPGPYNISIKVRSYDLHINEVLHNCCPFDVAEAPVYGTVELSHHWHGLVVVDASASLSAPQGLDPSSP